MPFSNAHVNTAAKFAAWVQRTNDVIDFVSNAANFGANSTPGGSNTQLQFNNSGAFGGSPLTWNGSTFSSSANVVIAAVLAVGQNVHIFGSVAIDGDESISGNVSVSQQLNVSNTSTLKGLIVTQATASPTFAIQATGNSSITGDLVVTGNLNATANNASHAFGKLEGDLNVNSAVTALTANNSTNVFGKTEGNLNVNSAAAALVANNATNAFGKTEGNLNVNSAAAALVANNATNAFGKTEGNLNANSALTANNATNFSGQAAAFYANAQNLLTGTVPTARLGTGTANSSTFLAGDQTYKTVGAGDVATNNVAANTIVVNRRLKVPGRQGGLKVNGIAAFTGTFNLANGFTMTVQNGTIMSILPDLPAPLLRWKLDEGSGSVIHEASGNSDWDMLLDGTFSWANGGVLLGGGGVASSNGTPTANLVLTGNVTIYGACRLTSNASIGHAPILTTTYGAGFKLGLSLGRGGANNGTAPSFWANAQFADGANPSSYFHDNSQEVWRIVCGQYDGTYLHVWVDEGEMANSNVSGSLSESITQLFIGNVGGINFPGIIGDIRLFASAHDTATRKRVTQDMRAIMNTRHLAANMVPLTVYLALEGDSIQAGTVGDGFYNMVVPNLSPKNIVGRNFAQSSSFVDPTANLSTFINMASTSRVSRLEYDLVPDATNILCIMIGANDLENFTLDADALNWLETKVKPYVKARRDSGFIIVMETVLPRSSGSDFEHVRLAVNTAIRNDPSWYDQLSDTGGAGSIMGAVATTADTNYYADGTHPTVLGYATYMPILVASIQAVINANIGA